MNTKLFALPALIVAALASACCFLPLLTSVLGISIGAVGAFAVFEKYRLVFIIATLLLLGVAYYKAYRGKEVCGPNGVCLVNPTSLRRTRILLWVIAVLALGFLLFPYFLR
jgi:mercuric ion transport protein